MPDTLRNRQYIIIGLFVISAVLLIFKALQLQVLNSSYRDKADATAIEKYTLYPSRGLIYDRTGKLLVYNNPMYDLMVTYNRISPNMDTLKFCKFLDITRASFEERLNKNWRDHRYSKNVPFVFLSKISADTYAKFQESMYEFPGFHVQLRNIRGYPHKSAAHVLGYIREVNKKEIVNSDEEYKYRRGDYIGASGLELAYEKDLRGKKGVSYIMKDNLGRDVAPYKGGKLDSIAVSGRDLITSLDLELQQYGELLLQNKVGSIVAIEPSSGEILAMISSPAYDPNILTINRDRGREYMKLAEDDNKPLFDRTIMAKYPPGSLFKPVVALIGMQEGILEPNRSVSCYGGYLLNGLIQPKCHGHPTASNVSIALQHSCNAYFTQVFRDIVDKNGSYNPEEGMEIFTQHLYDMGLGRTLGVDFPIEKKGNVPTPAYYDKVYGEKRWKSPYIKSLGIGQGEMLMTNIQMANLACMIANRGYYYIPHLVKGFRDGGSQIDEKYLVRKQVRIDSKHFPPVIDGMEKVVTSGTARIAFHPEIPICGKTGTAENPHGDDHSIFFAFAPKDKPKIAIAVYVEHGVWGSRYGAPIASLMIEKYLTGKVESWGRKYLENKMIEADLIHEEEEPLSMKQ